VADEAVVALSVPPPLTVHFTPALFESLVTLALKVTESVASTVFADGVTVTLTVFVPPPQPFMLKTATNTRPTKPILFANTVSSSNCDGRHI
jgi:hypothetical protein